MKIGYFATRLSLALAMIAASPTLFAQGASPAATLLSSDSGQAATGNGLEYVTGVSRRANASRLFLARFLPDGNLDPSFGPGGRVLVRLDAESEGRDVQQQPDGKLLVAGTYLLAQRELLVARFNADGSPDMAFGNAGIFRIRVGTNSIGRSVAVQGDGKILVAGESTNAITGLEFLVVRLNANGTLDSSFGSAGITLIQYGSSPQQSWASAVRALPDGRALVGGVTESPFLNVRTQLAMSRLQPDGSVDTSFGSANGLHVLGPTLSTLNAMTVGPDGSIWTAGGSVRGGMIFFTANKLGSNGVPDSFFGNGAGWGGPSSAWFGAPCPPAVGTIYTGAEVFALAVTSDKLLLAGPCSGKIGMARLDYKSIPDSSFGNAGMVADPVVTGEIRAVAVQPNGGIVAVGTSNGSILRARYDSAGARDTSYGTGGVTFTHLFDRCHASDFDGDARSDMLYRNVSDGRVHRMLMNGFATTSGVQAYVEPDLAWRIVAEGDFNGDGISDLLWRNDSNGQIFVMPFTAAGLPATGAVIHTETNIAWKIVATPDIDGDGKADIVWWNSNTGQLHVMLVNGLTLGAQGQVYTEPNLDWRIVASGDFAGSGKRNQLLWRNAATGQVYLMTVNVAGSTFGYTGQLIYTEPDLAWKILAAPDLDGDRKSDILWRNDVTGRVYGMLMNGPAIASQGYVYAEPDLAWKIVAQGDYNGDGKADILYRNESTGQVYMMQINCLAISAQATVYREPNTVWKILGPWEYGAS